ncbi:CoA-transferase family III [Gonapodya prolifera JEL478]|uniref:CoA-transferase family III n=1 Tax=Gonapodya prolifera (strain JEL478) TaxID=1344416 RepID=A0A139AXI7_GONPJ|nr:CoA-transferase family III [Gonapodya prolifera JEL478]|eukprot:KXS21427.1 CoA-transferase family III [Gonapodya prolifera JEL478]
MASISPTTVLNLLWKAASSDVLHPELMRAVTFTGPDRALASSFHLTQLAQAVIAAAGLSAAAIHRKRGGRAVTFAVDSQRAAVEFHSEVYCKLKHPQTGAIAPTDELWDKIAGVYRTRDNRWLRLHTNFPHHRDGVLALLNRGPRDGAPPTEPVVNSSDTVAHALLTMWAAADFEEEATKAGMVVSMMRSAPQFWQNHEQGRAITELLDANGGCPVTVRRIDDGSPPKPFTAYKDKDDGGGVRRPLQGVRVLDLTRIIAAPVGTRTLATYGADVLRLSSPNLPDIDILVKDCGRGKRSAHVDLTSSNGKSSLANLIRDCDVFVQSYRPGGLEKHGFGSDACLALRPGLVHASLSAYGRAGPWRGKRGFDSLVQTATGFNLDEAREYAKYGSLTSPCLNGRSLKVADADLAPRPFPVQALDHAAGYLLAFGVQVALLRRAVEGGAYTVDVSLAETAKFLRDLGQGDPMVSFGGEGLEGGEDALKLPSFEQAWERGYLEEIPSGWEVPQWGPGVKANMVAVKHAVEFAEDGHQQVWDGRSRSPPVPNGTHPPDWW